jgi:hypothetical protein
MGYLKYFLLFLLPLSALGQPFSFGDSAVFGGAVATSSCTSIACDAWQDFEFDGDVTATALQGTDHGSLTWGTSGIGTTNTCTSTLAELKALGCPQGTADTGTRGLRITNSIASQQSFFQATISADDEVSAGT